MTDPQSMSKAELIDLLAEQAVALHKKDEELHKKDEELHKKEEELHKKDKTLRRQDADLQIQDHVIASLTKERDELKAAWDKLMQQRFKNRSERYIDNPDQLRLDFGDTAAAEDAAIGLAEAVEEREVASYTRRRRRHDRGLPAHFERYEVIADAPPEVTQCDEHGERTLLPEAMWDRTETLEFEPPKARVRVTVYRKYACKSHPECGIRSPERPMGIASGLYDSSIASEIITGKYAYHLPLYRLQDYFAGCGWTPSRSTQCNILEHVWFIIEPLLAHFKRTLLTDSRIGCDDTGLTLLYPKVFPDFNLDDPREKRIHDVFTEARDNDKSSINAKMWAYRGVTVKLNLFDFTVSRHRDGPNWFFSDFRGTLLGDCWHGFKSIAMESNGSILRAACNAHARRKFENDAGDYPEEQRQWLLWYQQLYDIEDRARNFSAEQRVQLRQSESKPIWEDIVAWMQAARARTEKVVTRGSGLAKAMNYVDNHFTELTRYLDDGMLPMDNNETEQLMRQVALGRKNWLFAGSVHGGERNAAFLSLATSAVRNDLHVWSYVKDVIDTILAGSTDYDSLLPWNWREAHPDAVRQYRVKERKTRAEAKAESRRKRRKNLKSKQK